MVDAQQAAKTAPLRRDVVATWESLMRGDMYSPNARLQRLVAMALLRGNHELSREVLAGAVKRLTDGSEEKLKDALRDHRGGYTTPSYFTIIPPTSQPKHHKITHPIPNKVKLSWRGSVLVTDMAAMLKPFYFCGLKEVLSEFKVEGRSVFLPTDAGEVLRRCNGFEVSDLALIVLSSTQGGVSSAQARHIIYRKRGRSNFEEKKQLLSKKVLSLVETGFIKESTPSGTAGSVYTITNDGKRLADAFYHLLC